MRSNTVKNGPIKSVNGEYDLLGSENLATSFQA